MQFISCHNGKLQTLESAGLKASAGRSFVTGLEAIDDLLPGKTFARGAVHELLAKPSHGQPTFFAALLAQAAACPVGANLVFALSPSSSQKGRTQGSPLQDSPVIWSDPRAEIYPPALAAMGLDLSRIYLLRPQSIADESWAITECLRCKGVGAVIAAPKKLSRIEARRLQLAAETGGTVGLLMRTTGRGSEIYSAATRWLIEPHPGEPTIQRWKIQLIHGHGGRVGQPVILECCRETNTVRATEKLADRQTAEKATPRRAIA